MADLRGGYRLADLDQMAHAAVRTAGRVPYDALDRYHDARSAIAEHLYAAPTPPAVPDLVQAGRQAIWRAAAETKHHHGWYQPTNTWGGSPAFQRYWRPMDSPVEDRVVERVALHQILPALTRRQHDVVAALAALGDHQTAQAAVGGRCFSTHLARARRRFLALWHEGEVPSRPWGSDRRRGARRTASAIIRRRQADRGPVDFGPEQHDHREAIRG